MKSRCYFVFLTLMLVPACYGDASESAGGGGDEAAQAEAPADDQAALMALAEYYVTHYNMHHASMIADLYVDDGIGLMANGATLFGRDAILANLEADMEGSPTIDITPSEFMVLGDNAIGHGAYSVETTPPGAETTTMSGNWLASYARQDDGNWKLGVVTTNLSHEWPEGMMAQVGGAEEMEPEGTMGDLIGGYMTHYNLGHPSMVADYYTEDAKTARSGNAPASGREAIAAQLEASMEARPGGHLVITDMGTEDLGDGWALDGGYYTVSAGEGGDLMATGSYMALVRQGDDGSWRLHWSINNGWPAEAVPPAM